MLRRLRRAQSTAEYAILIGLVVGAVLAMQIYVRRGLQGRIRDVVDYVGDEGDTQARLIFTGEQYEPYYLSADAHTDQAITEDEELQRGGGVRREITGTTTATRDQVIGW